MYSASRSSVGDLLVSGWLMSGLITTTLFFYYIYHDCHATFEAKSRSVKDAQKLLKRRFISDDLDESVEGTEVSCRYSTGYITIKKQVVTIYCDSDPTWFM